MQKIYKAAMKKKAENLSWKSFSGNAVFRQNPSSHSTAPSPSTAIGSNSKNLPPATPPTSSLCLDQNKTNEKTVHQSEPNPEASAQKSQSLDLPNAQTDDAIYKKFIEERPEVRKNLKEAMRHHPGYALIIKKMIIGVSLYYAEGISNEKKLLGKAEILSRLGAESEAEA